MPAARRRHFLWILSTAILLGICLFALCSENPQAQARVWVLREGEIAEYSPSDWTLLNTIQVPREFFRDPDRLQVTSTGEMLFSMDPEIQFGDPGQHFPSDRIWVWNGRSASIIKRLFDDKRSGGANGERRPILSLSADGRRLFWFENEFREKQDGEERSVLTKYGVWQTDLTGANPEQLASFTFPTCKCETGACNETCPEAGFWFPRAGVDAFFFVTHWIPGQLGATFQSTFLFEKTGGKWTSKKLAEVFEEVLDAAQGGRIVIHTIGDGGCCGWDNAGIDETLVAMNGRKTQIFNERQKYGNSNYDVSFYTANAKLSPSTTAAALTIISSGKPGDEIRLSDSGKENPGELARIRKALELLPVTEVMNLANPDKPLVSLSHVALGGWLSDREILIAESGVLTAFDIVTKSRRISPIKIPGIASVFVR